MSVFLMNQPGYLVCFSRERNSACPLDRRLSLACFSHEGKSACLLVRPASLDCFSRELRSVCLNRRKSLACFTIEKSYPYYCVMYQP